jgi:predicted transcriptional regulator
VSDDLTNRVFETLNDLHERQGSPVSSAALASALGCRTDVVAARLTVLRSLRLVVSHHGSAPLTWSPLS